LETLSCLARDGYTDAEIAERMGISLPRLRFYRLKQPEIDKAIRHGKEFIDNKVESALLKAALGLKTMDLKVTIVMREGVVVSTAKTSIAREFPPNVMACQTWLFNRQRDKWKRNRSNEITMEDNQ